MDRQVSKTMENYYLVYYSPQALLLLIFPTPASSTPICVCRDPMAKNMVEDCRSGFGEKGRCRPVNERDAQTWTEVDEEGLLL